MSCCGIDPIASVRNAVTKASHSLAPPLGQNSNFPASAAAAMTLPGPPAMSPTNQAMIPRPTMIMTDWKRSVMATDHIQPQMVYARMTRQTEDPKGSAIMPPSPLLENSTDTESTLSAPNQVAKTVAVFM